MCACVEVSGSWQDGGCHMWRWADKMADVFSATLHLLFLAGSFSGFETETQSQGPPEPSVPATSALRLHLCAAMPHFLPRRCLGSELRAPCSCGKSFTNFAVSPAPPRNFLCTQSWGFLESWHRTCYDLKFDFPASISPGLGFQACTTMPLHSARGLNLGLCTQ